MFNYVIDPSGNAVVSLAPFNDPLCPQLVESHEDQSTNEDESSEGIDEYQSTGVSITVEPKIETEVKPKMAYQVSFHHLTLALPVLSTMLSGK
jgi:hypothetical protein